MKLDETDRLLREERALWEERRGKFLELHKTTAALQAEVDAQPDNSPEVIGPVLEQAKALQTRCADLTRQIEDCEKGCAEAERLWGDRQQRYAIMREEVDRNTGIRMVRTGVWAGSSEQMSGDDFWAGFLPAGMEAPVTADMRDS